MSLGNAVFNILSTLPVVLLGCWEDVVKLCISFLTHKESLFLRPSLAAVLIYKGTRVG